MTVPILPGPFSFLQSAGEAAGEYGQVKEERRRHGEEIAHRAITDLIGMIQAGQKPVSVLADPEVQKLFKTAYGVSIPAVVLPQPKEQRQVLESTELAGIQPGTPEARMVTGLPTPGGVAQEEVNRRTAQAALSQGLPELQADTQAAQAEAQRLGATFNSNVYRGARALLGTDRNYRRLAIEAATGVLDYRLRLFIAHREDLSLARQLAADNARILMQALGEGGKRYDAAVKEWDTQLRNSILLQNKDPEDPEVYRTFAAANPPPDENKIAEDYLQNYFGFGLNEFRQRLGNALHQMGEGAPGGGTAAAGGSSGTVSASMPWSAFTHGGLEAGGATDVNAPNLPGEGRIQTALTFLSKPENFPSFDKAGEYLADAVASNELTDVEASAILARLRGTLPAGSFTKLERAYASFRLSGSRSRQHNE